MPLNSNDIAGLFATMMVLSIPIVAILTKHQRKMAELVHQNAQPIANAETQMLRQEIQELKSLVHQQAIALDNLARPIPTAERIQERVG